MAELRDTVRPGADDLDAEPESLRELAMALAAEGSRKLARAADLNQAARRKELILAGLPTETEEES